MDRLHDIGFYLPEIIFAVLVTVALIGVILMVRDQFRYSNGKITCIVKELPTKFPGILICFYYQSPLEINTRMPLLICPPI